MDQDVDMNAPPTELATLMEFEEEATQMIAEPPVAEQKARENIDEVAPVVSEQKVFEKIAEQPGGVAPVPSEQKATEEIADPGAFRAEGKREDRGAAWCDPGGVGAEGNREDR